MVVVTNKATGSSSTVAGNNIVLSSPSVVKLSLSPRAIADYQKIGDDLVIRLHNGERQSELFIFMLIIRMAMIMI